MRPAETFRVVTQNLWAAPTATRECVASAADAIAAHEPDVVCLQEVTMLPGGQSTARLLADHLGFTLAVEAIHPGDTPAADPGAAHGVAVLTRHPVTSTDVHPLPGGGADSHAVSATLTSGSGRTWRAVSTHLAWGGDAEPDRLRQAQALEVWCRSFGDDAVTVLGGDLNTLPCSDTLRYLTGLAGHTTPGTYWIDTWAHNGNGPGATLNPANPLAAEQAAVMGVTRPGLLPRRRIDYVLVRGWLYGQAGSPVMTELVGEYVPTGHDVPPSDHYGVAATLWDPALSYRANP